MPRATPYPDMSASERVAIECHIWWNSDHLTTDNNVVGGDFVASQIYMIRYMTKAFTQRRILRRYSFYVSTPVLCVQMLGRRTWETGRFFLCFILVFIRYERQCQLQIDTPRTFLIFVTLNGWGFQMFGADPTEVVCFLDVSRCATKRYENNFCSDLVSPNVGQIAYLFA